MATAVTRQVLKSEFKKEFAAFEKRMEKKFVTKEDAKKFATKSDLAEMEVRMEDKFKELLEVAVQDIIQTVNDAFVAVPNRVEFYGLERRVRRLEAKAK